MPTVSPIEDQRQERRAIPSEVIAASRDKFLYFGVHRTTMADISRQIGMPRQALYEYVASRDDLVQAVLIQRIREIAEEVQALDQDSFADALLKTSVAAIRVARSDKELMNLVTTAPKNLVQKVVVGHCQEIHDIVCRLFEPILERGTKSGQLRTDKSYAEIVDWFRIVFLALITQTDIDPDTERSVIADFLLPSVMLSLPKDKDTKK